MDGQVLVVAVAEQLKLKTKVVDMFVPGKPERTVLSILRVVFAAHWAEVSLLNSASICRSSRAL